MDGHGIPEIEYYKTVTQAQNSKLVNRVKCGKYYAYNGITGGNGLKRENLFDSIKDNFFRILTGQNKRFYSDCLIEMHEVSIFTDAADFDRELVNQVISSCMEWYADTLAEENTSEEDNTNTLPGQEKMDTCCPPTKDSVFRKLLACGWIDADFDDQTHRQLVSFTVPALTIIPELKRMAQPSRISLGGYTRNIIENLKAVMTARHPYQDAFMLALNNTYQFMQEMSKIRISIKNEVETILRCKNLEEMTSMLSAYLDSYLDGDYYKLQFAENLTAVERKQITGLLMDIENNETVFQNLIEGAMDYMSIDSEEDANLLILRSVETIRCRLCDEYERQYREIQKNQARYVNNAAGRMPMLIADKKDTDSTINRLVYAISECDDEEYADPMTPVEWLKELHQLLCAPRAAELGEPSIYKPRTPPREDVGFMKPLPPKEKKELNGIDVAGCIPKYSAKTVNRRLDMYMAGKDHISVTDLPLSTQEDFYEMVSMVLFSDDPDCNYEVEMEPGHIEREGYSASNFIVKWKTNKRKAGDILGI